MKMRIRKLLLAVTGAAGLLVACSASSESPPLDLTGTPPGEDGGPGGECGWGGTGRARHL